MRRNEKSGDKTTVISTILDCFGFVPKTRRSSGDYSAR